MGFEIKGKTLLEYKDEGDEEVFIPDGVTTIEPYAFSFIDSMTTLHFPKSVRTFKSDKWSYDEITSVFYACDRLERFEVAKDNKHFKSVDGAIYSKDGKKLVRVAPAAKSFTFKKGVTELGPHCFEGCSFDEIIIPYGVKHIGLEAFCNCTLGRLIIPDTVLTVGTDAFQANFKNVNDLLYIPEKADIRGIFSRHYLKGGYPIIASVHPKKILCIGDLRYEKVKGRPLSQMELQVTGEDGRLIGFQFSMKGGKVQLAACCTEGEKVTIPSEYEGRPVTGIESGCFVGLPNIKTIVLPRSIDVSGIAGGSIQDCGSIESIVYEDDPKTSINLLAIEGNTLEKIITLDDEYAIPEGIEKVKAGAFVAPRLKRLVITGNASFGSPIGIESTLEEVEYNEGASLIPGSKLFGDDGTKIKRVLLPSGEVLEEVTPELYACLSNAKDGPKVSWSKVAGMVNKIGSEPKRYKMARNLVLEHAEEMPEKDLAKLADIAIRYCIAKKKPKDFRELLNVDVPLKLNFNSLMKFADSNGDPEIKMLLMERSAKEKGGAKESEIEEPAPTAQFSEYIKVRFPNQKTYRYRCGFDVKVGDKVFVPGTMAGEPGEVVEILKDYWPSGQASRNILNVEKAFNIKRVKNGGLRNL